MALEQASFADSWDTVFGSEWPRLVGLCAHLTGNAQVAEDLAQETALEAWRHRHRLREPHAQARWLSAIARNVCRRWAHTRARELTDLRAMPPQEDDEIPASAELQVTTGYDVAVELERNELAALLDHALGLLPPETRAVLMQKYIQDYPQTEIAARLGTTTGAVEARLHRGKLALQRILATELHRDAMAFGLLEAPGSEWQETRIWCPVCGQRRLVGRSLAHHGEFSLRCPGCFPNYHSAPALNIVQTTCSGALVGVRGFKPSLTRIMTDWDATFKRACIEGQIPCSSCGRPALLRMGCGPLSPNWPAGLSTRGVHWSCDRCGEISDLHLLSLTLYDPVGRRFWQQHPRIRMLPEHEIESDGRPALLTRFESLNEHAILEVVSARDTYQLLHITPSQ